MDPRSRWLSVACESRFSKVWGCSGWENFDCAKHAFCSLKQVVFGCQGLTIGWSSCQGTAQCGHEHLAPHQFLSQLWRHCLQTRFGTQRKRCHAADRAVSVCAMQAAVRGHSRMAGRVGNRPDAATAWASPRAIRNFLLLAGHFGNRVNIVGCVGHFPFPFFCQE